MFLNFISTTEGFGILLASITNPSASIVLLRSLLCLPKPQRARLSHRLGNRTNVIHYAGELLKDSTNEAPALALAAHLLWETGETSQATNALHQLRAISSRFELETPILARLRPISRAMGLAN